MSDGFTVSKDKSGFQSVFPEPLKSLEETHIDELEAWHHIVMARGDNIANSAGMSKSQWKIEQPIRCAKALWAALGDTPVNGDDEIEERFLGFEKGTDRQEIWHWFEESFNLSAHDLMYGELQGEQMPFDSCACRPG